MCCTKRAKKRKRKFSFRNNPQERTAGKPEFQLAIILKNGNVKSFRQALSSPLDANAKLTLTLSLGDIFSEESSGDFTVDDWNEKNENIDIPIIE